MVEISMKRNKGFSLVELLVSLLVVSIALLGFAALQTFSAKTIRTAEHKNVGNEVTQSVVKYLQMSQDSVRSINWNGQNAILFDCTQNNAPAGFNNTLINGLNDLCATINNVSGIVGSELAIEFTMTVPGNLSNDFAFYTASVHYAYRPIRTQRSRQQLNDQEVGNIFITVNNYCPFQQDQGQDNLVNLRQRDNVMCDIVEVRL
jgi:type IV pilus modification protein PilV